jgi:CAF1 family ribonuclease
MTGISIPGSKRPAKDDTTEERFAELRKVPERYSIVQVGVAMFHANPEWVQGSELLHETNEFTVRKYNFFLFPPANNYVTREVTLNPSSVAFLNEHSMDFDLWTKKGVGFVTGDVAADLLQKYKKHHRQVQEQSHKSLFDGTRSNVTLTRTEDIHFHARAMASLREWIDGARPEDGVEGSSFLLPLCNSFLRRALYESIGTEYPSLILEKHMNQIRVLRMNQAEQELRQERLAKESWDALIMDVGFWRIFHAISMANKGFTVKNHLGLAKSHDEVSLEGVPEMVPLGRQVPVAVHNGLMDLLFLMTHLHAHTLPDTFAETKELISSYFPLLYDTKVLSTECYRQEQNTVLENLFIKFVAETPRGDSKFQVIFDGEEQPHEASYDAFMTGAVFCRLVQLIGQDLPEFPPSSETGPFPLERVDDSILRTMFGRNKLYLMMAMYTIDLEEVDDPLSRGLSAATTYRVEGSDPSVTTRDIVRCMTESGSVPVKFEIVWVDDTTFLVAARDEENPESLPGKGDQIRRALENRFTNASICCLAEYIDKQNRPVAAAKVSWTTRMLELLGWKRTRNGDEEGSKTEEPKAKRQRIS